MQLNSITLNKTNQWLKKNVFFLIFFIFTVFCILLTIYFTGKQKGSDFYVDSKYNGFIKWGSEKYPLNGIRQTLKLASKKEIHSPIIHIKDGEYFENIIIPNNVKLLGEKVDKTIIRQDYLSPVIIMQGDSEIKNITIAGGSIGIVSEGNSIIEKCIIKDFKNKGIDAVTSDFKIVINNSIIHNGSNKDIYIQRGRKIEISENKIYSNQGEGLDLRDNVSGIISKNELYDNSESGIELIVGGSFLDIKENNIWGNRSSGITCQYYENSPEKGKILIQANRIKAINSEKYTITVKSPSGGKGRIENYWKDSIIITSDNILDGNINNRSLEISN